MPYPTSLEAAAAAALEINVEPLHRDKYHESPFQAEVHAPKSHDRRRMLRLLLREHVARLHVHAACSESAAGRIVERLAHCCRRPILYRSDDSGTVRLIRRSCRHRLCPTCSPGRVGKARTRIQAIVEAMDSPRFLTLTQATSNRPLKDSIKKIYADFRRLRQRKCWASHVRGGVAVLEITWSNGGWHPHLHALLDGTYWPQDQIADQWQAVTGDSRIVDIRAIHSRTQATNYVAKYVSKGADPRALPDDQVAEFALAIAGVRTLQTFGASHAVKVPADPKVESEASIIVHDFDLMHFGGEHEATRRTFMPMLITTAGLCERGKAKPEAVRGILAALARRLRPPVPKPLRPPDPQLRLWRHHAYNTGTVPAHDDMALRRRQLTQRR